MIPGTGVRVTIQETKADAPMKEMTRPGGPAERVKGKQAAFLKKELSHGPTPADAIAAGSPGAAGGEAPEQGEDANREKAQDRGAAGSATAEDCAQGSLRSCRYSCPWEQGHKTEACPLHRRNRKRGNLHRSRF